MWQNIFPLDRPRSTVAGKSYRRPEDWYAVTVEDFNKHKGRAMLVGEYGDSADSAVMGLFPNHAWQAWRFHKAPNGFWKKAENCLRYLQWLANELGYHRPEDWYGIRTEDFNSHFGSECLRFYRRSPALAAMALFPDYAWEEWRFTARAHGFLARAGESAALHAVAGEAVGVSRGGGLAPRA